MSTPARLSDAQINVLTYSALHAHGKLDLSTSRVKGGARQKILTSLCNRALIRQMNEDWYLTPEGYDAIGLSCPKRAIGEDATAYAKENTKQAQVIRMLQRFEGATAAQLCEATGWLPHTVRAMLSCALKKKLQLNVISHKSHCGDRIYRIP